MPRIDVECQLTYQVRMSTVFLFQIVAARTNRQQIVSEELVLNPALDVEHCQIGTDGNQLQRVVVAPCEFRVSYRATVDLMPGTQNSNDIGESPISQTPAEVLTFLNPVAIAKAICWLGLPTRNLAICTRGSAAFRRFVTGSMSNWTTRQAAQLPPQQRPTFCCNGQASVAIMLIWQSRFAEAWAFRHDTWPDMP